MKRTSDVRFPVWHHTKIGEKGGFREALPFNGLLLASHRNRLFDLIIRQDSVAENLMRETMMKKLKPVVIYDATSNAEADLVKIYLEQHDVPARAVADSSMFGFGNVAGLHRPQVWVDFVNAPRAADLIQQFLMSKQSSSKANASETQRAIAVICEDCGANNTFEGSLVGTVQECLECRAYVDVGPVDFPQEAD